VVCCTFTRPKEERAHHRRLEIHAAGNPTAAAAAARGAHGRHTIVAWTAKR